MTVVEPTSTPGESHGATGAGAGRPAPRAPRPGASRAPAPEALGDVQHDVGGGAGRDPRPRDTVGREPHRRVRFQVGANVLGRQAGALEDLVELPLGPLLGLVEYIWQRDRAWTSASPLISSGAYRRSGCLPTTPAMAPMLIVFGIQKVGRQLEIMWAFFFW